MRESCHWHPTVESICRAKQTIHISAAWCCSHTLIECFIITDFAVSRWVHAFEDVGTDSQKPNNIIRNWNLAEPINTHLQASCAPILLHKSDCTSQLVHIKLFKNLQWSLAQHFCVSILWTIAILKCSLSSQHLIVHAGSFLTRTFLCEQWKLRFL